jgi:hypothetical protein
MQAGRAFIAALAMAGLAVPAWAHVGSKDVFEQVQAGPYKLFVTIRPPTVIPGVAGIEVRSSGAAARSMTVTPMPLTGEASKHPPAADRLTASAADPAFFTGSLWLMASGSWQVRFAVDGDAGKAMASVPVPAVPLAMLKMERPLEITLGALGVMLVLGMAGIVAAAVRESRLAPGAAADGARRTRALIASAVALVVVLVIVWGGARWWKVEAAGYAGDVYRPLTMTPELAGDTLDLRIGSFDGGPEHQGRSRSNDDLLPDHGHLMHLYAIREPEMDAAFHLHPARVGAGDLRMNLPAMPPGEYKLYADVVHANGFPETLTATLEVPAGMAGGALAAEDAKATPQGLAAGELGTSYTLPDGYRMVWDKPQDLTAATAYALRFRLLDAAGKPAAGMELYLGMAGHAAFVKTDGTVFAHTHPEGSASMQAMMLANGGDSGGSGDSGGDMAGMEDMPGMDMSGDAAPVAPVVEFPYGFPTAGRYRVFVQMKHGGVVETGVFDAEVK